MTGGGWAGSYVRARIPADAPTGWGNVSIVYQGSESLPKSYLIGIPMDSLRKFNLLRPDYCVYVDVRAPDGTISGAWSICATCANLPFEPVVVWNGNQFRGIWRDTMNVSGVCYSNVVSDVSATLSADGTAITSLVIDRTSPYGDHARIVLKPNTSLKLNPSYYFFYNSGIGTWYLGPPSFVAYEQDVLNNFDITGTYVGSGTTYTIVGMKPQQGFTRIWLNFSR
jgi:hypothetical protein